MRVVRAGWTSASFLIYAGALLALSSALEWQLVIAGEHGSGAWAGWSVLFFAVAVGLTRIFHRRERPLVAGLFGVVAVGLFAAMVGAFFHWFDWLTSKPGPFSGFFWGDLGLELLVLLAALVALRRLRLPLFVAIAAGAAWFFVTDVLSSGGNWSAWVTLFVGVVFYVVGRRLDTGDRRPYGFWLHVAAGLQIGGALLFFWHSTDFQWALIIVAALVYIGHGAALRRSSYAVLGALGLVAATGHYSAPPAFVPLFGVGGGGVVSSTTVGSSSAAGGTLQLGADSTTTLDVSYSPWQGPVAYLCLGLFLALVGMLLHRRHGAAELV